MRENQMKLSLVALGTIFGWWVVYKTVKYLWVVCMRREPARWGLKRRSEGLVLW